MGKALPKTCALCKMTVSGNNWARHQRTHKGAIAQGQAIRGKVELKRGRPKKTKPKHPLDTWNVAKQIERRGEAIYFF